MIRPRSLARSLSSLLVIVLGPILLLAAVMSLGISTMPAGAQSSSCGNAVVEPGEDCDPPGNTSCLGGATCENDCTCPTPTTTTLPGCVPADCDDGDPCTTDTCTGSTCTNVPLTGLELLTCQVDALGGVLDNAPSDQLGGTKIEKRLDAKFDKIQSRIASALAAEGSSRERKLKKARKLLQDFIKQVQKGVEKGKIDPVVGQQMIDLATGATEAAQS